MKCKKWKRLVCLLLALSMLAVEAVMVGAAELPEVSPVSQAETEDSNEPDGDGLVIGVVQMPMTRATGDVIGRGVRLRKGPDNTSTVLELMDYGETVFIDTVVSASVPGGQWLYVKRDKTGTWGWVARSCIAY